jgi:hypothetical protein
MKKAFLITVLLLIVANAIITILEQQFYLSTEIHKAQENILSAAADTNINNLYPASLLFKKIMIWLLAFSTIAIALYYIKVDYKKYMEYFIVGFYTIGCFLNTIIVPHPAWVVFVSLVLPIVTFKIVTNILVTLTELSSITQKTINNQSQQPLETNFG